MNFINVITHGVRNNAGPLLIGVSATVGIPAAMAGFVFGPRLLWPDSANSATTQAPSSISKILPFFGPRAPFVKQQPPLAAVTPSAPAPIAPNQNSTPPPPPSTPVSSGPVASPQPAPQPLATLSAGAAQMQKEREQYLTNQMIEGFEILGDYFEGLKIRGCPSPGRPEKIDLSSPDNLKQTIQDFKTAIRRLNYDCALIEKSARESIQALESGLADSSKGRAAVIESFLTSVRNMRDFPPPKVSKEHFDKYIKDDFIVGANARIAREKARAASSSTPAATTPVKPPHSATTPPAKPNSPAAEPLMDAMKAHPELPEKFRKYVNDSVGKLFKDNEQLLKEKVSGELNLKFDSGESFLASIPVIIRSLDVITGKNSPPLSPAEKQEVAEKRAIFTGIVSAFNTSDAEGVKALLSTLQEPLMDAMKNHRELPDKLRELVTTRLGKLFKDQEEFLKANGLRELTLKFDSPENFIASIDSIKARLELLRDKQDTPLSYAQKSAVETQLTLFAQMEAAWKKGADTGIDFLLQKFPK